MTHDAQDRFERDLSLDPKLDEDTRQGLTGTAPSDMYALKPYPDQTTIPPNPKDPEQPRWRIDFAIDWPEDHYVARRDFVKFLVLTSGAFVAGQGWIAAQSLVRSRRSAAARRRIASLGELPPGSVVAFNFPGEHDPCLLVRAKGGELVAYSQKCTHLSCAVIPKIEEGVLHCPCHEGYFDLLTGRNVAGPPPRPLPKIVLEVEGDEVYAIAVETRTS